MSTPSYLLVDGENIDATLGMSVLGRRPEPDERPRWDRVLDFCDDAWGQEDEETNALFFLNATNGHMPMGFVQALIAMDYRPLPLQGTGSPEEKVVDLGIQRTLEAIASTGTKANVLLGSHDADYVPQVEALLEAGCQVGVLCFRELLSQQLSALQSKGLRVHDLEYDVKAFTSQLPRVRIIPLAEFNPFDFI